MDGESWYGRSAALRGSERSPARPAEPPLPPTPTCLCPGAASEFSVSEFSPACGLGLARPRVRAGFPDVNLVTECGGASLWPKRKSCLGLGSPHARVLPIRLLRIAASPLAWFLSTFYPLTWEEDSVQVPEAKGSPLTRALVSLTVKWHLHHCLPSWVLVKVF